MCACVRDLVPTVGAGGVLQTLLLSLRHNILSWRRLLPVCRDALDVKGYVENVL